MSVRLNHPKSFAATDRNPADIERFLAVVTTEPVIRSPFNHLITTGAFSNAFLDALIDEYPGEDLMLKVADRMPSRRYSDRRLSLSLPEPSDPELQRLPALYRRLSDLLRAPVVVNRLLRLFPNEVQATVQRLRPLLNSQSFDVRVAIEMNYDRTGFELRPHTDGRLKLVTGLLSLADPGDPEDLGTRLYQPKDPAFSDPGTKALNPRHFVEVGRVPYRRNTLLLFGRSDRSFHGVAPSDSGIGRRLIQFSIVLDIEKDITEAIDRFK